MSALDVSRESISLPSDLSREIIQKTQESSAVMRLATKIDLPGNGLTIPVITGDPTPEWVAETDEKPVSTPTMDEKLMTPYTLAVIVPFSNQFRRDAERLYSALVDRLPRTLAQTFDSTVFGGTAVPGTNFDSFASVTTQTLSWAGLVAAQADIADNNGIMNGIVVAPQAISTLLSTVDQEGRPLYINSFAEGAIPRVIGVPTHQSKAAYIAGTSTHTVAFAGDWTQALYGTVEDVKISIADQATLTSGSDTINLWQRNMFAVRAEIEIGFRADTDCFNALTISA